MMEVYVDAYYLLNDVALAEVISRKIIGHDAISDLLETMVSRHIGWIKWFELSESTREIISDYCGIKPHGIIEVNRNPNIFFGQEWEDSS